MSHTDCLLGLLLLLFSLIQCIGEHILIVKKKKHSHLDVLTDLNVLSPSEYQNVAFRIPPVCTRASLNG